MEDEIEVSGEQDPVVNDESQPINADNQDVPRPPRKLSTFEGVFTPVCLAMFSAILFLRLGYILGNAGLLETLAQMVIAYTILMFTVLSVSAISTNGAIEGGGIYFMSSRVLGPEFGGAIGLLFFIANVVASALNLAGCVEELMDNYGPGTKASFLPGGEGMPLAYASLLNLFNLVVCIFGATMFAKTTLVIFSVVATVTISVMMSLLFTTPTTNIPVATENHITNLTNLTFTGLSLATFRSNLFPNYTFDYTINLTTHARNSTITTMTTDFATVFGVFFTGVTGVLAGANMSGDLKNPSKSIPLGTISGLFFTFFVYTSLFTLTAATCSRDLLQNNYLYMQFVNVWPPLVEIGIFSATMSAALTGLIGASRLLNAIAMDQLFGWVLDPLVRATVNGNPLGSVLATWFFIQLMLMIGSFNKIAQISSILFLYTYFAINLSCMMCLLTSAPNFRPSFKYFNLATTAIGLVGSLAMTFVINPLYASLVIIVSMLFMVAIHLRSPPVQWGSIAQALLFHQVRKYLLLLDHKKEHIKYWRPRILLMVKNPRTCLPLIDFVNDLKKSGLFVMGHIELGQWEQCTVDPIIVQYPRWLKWLDRITIKAFIEMTLAPSVRDGLPHVARIAGLGAMKLNTLMFGFYDDSIPIDFLQNDERYRDLDSVFEAGEDEDNFAIRRNGRPDEKEYVGMIRDTMTKLQKTVCLARHFEKFDMKKIGKKPDQLCYIDVWPINFFNPRLGPDNCACLIMQFACVLHMVPKWKSTTVRLLICTSKEDRQTTLHLWTDLVAELRIDAEIVLVEFDFDCTRRDSNQERCPFRPVLNWNNLELGYADEANVSLTQYSNKTAVTFLYLPEPPRVEDQYRSYLENLKTLTEDMPPTLLVYGNDQVISTSI